MAEDSLDNVYRAPTEELYPEEDPVMIPAKDFSITMIVWTKTPEKAVVVHYKRASEDGEDVVESSATFANSAFQQYRKHMSIEGENLGAQNERAAYEGLVAKGKIPADATII